LCLTRQISRARKNDVQTAAAQRITTLLGRFLQNFPDG
jgi:hypothetical protein